MHTLVVRPLVLVRDLLVDPREQTNRRIGKGVSERLRLSTLYGSIPASLGLERLSACEPFFLGLGIGRQKVDEVELGERPERRWEGSVCYINMLIRNTQSAMLLTV